MHFPANPGLYPIAFLFVCICRNIKAAVQNACNVFSVLRQQRALCSPCALNVEMLNI